MLLVLRVSCPSPCVHCQPVRLSNSQTSRDIPQKIHFSGLDEKSPFPQDENENEFDPFRHEISLRWQLFGIGRMVELFSFGCVSVCVSGTCFSWCWRNVYCFGRWKGVARRNIDKDDGGGHIWQYGRNDRSGCRRGEQEPTAASTVPALASQLTFESPPHRHDVRHSPPPSPTVIIIISYSLLVSAIQLYWIFFHFYWISNWWWRMIVLVLIGLANIDCYTLNCVFFF